MHHLRAFVTLIFATKNTGYYIVGLMFVLVKEDTDRASPIEKNDSFIKIGFTIKALT